jgi:hypothetical protein
MVADLIDIETAKKDFATFVNTSEHDIPISELYRTFIVEKMKLDKYFSEFLEDNQEEMDQSANFDSPAWKAYREKLKEYNDVEKLIAKSKYYLNKHVR